MREAGAMTQTPESIVRDFCAAWERLDLDELLSYLTDDAIYHNIPIDPLVGHDAIRAMMTMFTNDVIKIEFRMLHLAASGNVVLTERLDVFHKEGSSIELPVMGTFEIRDGKIAAWRDYFDLNQYMQQAT
jgi:limonene-1,2-epoxide hydrolase